MDGGDERARLCTGRSCGEVAGDCPIVVLRSQYWMADVLRPGFSQRIKPESPSLIKAMAISVAQLEKEVREMSTRDAPGRDFCNSIAELARSGRFTELRGVLPEVLFEELGARYSADPAAFVAGWKHLAQDMRKGFVQHARERLTSLTRG